MKNRPLFFVILAVFHLIEPLIKLLVFRLKTGFGYEIIMSNIMQMGGTLALFEFWFLFPIAGVALMGVKRWSYPIFVGVQAYSLYGHLSYTSYSWPYVDKYPHLFSLVILALNAGLILYFLLPDVRRPFFDKDLRWWEHRVRYPARLAMAFSKGDPNKLMSAQFLNLSLSGAFMKYSHFDLVAGELIRIHLSAYGENLSIEAQVVSRHHCDGEAGVGLKFTYQNLWENLAMRRIIQALARERKRNQIEKPPIAA